MPSLNIVRKAAALADATNTNSIDTAELSKSPLALCLIRVNAAITEVIGKITMSDDDENFYPIFDEDGAELKFTVKDIGYIRLKPSDYAVFAKHLRIEFASGVSANASFELYFRVV